MYRFLWLSGLIVSLTVTSTAQAEDFCPYLYERGVLELEFNPAFVHVDKYDTEFGFGADGLTISSFHNVYFNPEGFPPIAHFERDLVARIPYIDWVSPSTFAASTDIEILTDLDTDSPKMVWPNEAVRAPDGVFPFEAVVIPQGFHPTPAPGRLTALEIETNTEYVIHQSVQDPGGFTFPGDPNNSPRFYHQVLFVDMNDDGLKDIVTVRSGFRVGVYPYPPYGELVYFVNPGEELDAETPWAEIILWGGPAAEFLGPDISLDLHDFDGDDIPEFVVTNFFNGEVAIPGGPPPTNGAITLIGAPEDGTWADVNASIFSLPRVATINNDQGFPFNVQVADLNMDGRADILASNHQPDNCLPFTSSEVPGRVYALEQPASGDIFDDEWTLHILFDDIRPNPTLDPITPPGRLAPGRAQAFWPLGFMEGIFRPHIVVGGDEASKVWILRPRNEWDPDNWEYDSAVIFDVNDYYGPEVTQTPMEDPFGVTISTIGGIAVRNTGIFGLGAAEIYIPVLEAMDIHVFTYGYNPWRERVTCGGGEPVECPAPPMPPF